MNTRILLLGAFLVACGGQIDGNGIGSGGGSGSGSGGGSGNGGGSGGISGGGSGSDCGGGVRLAKSSPEARRVATDGSFVYWTTWGDPGTQKNGSVWRVPVKGGTPEKIASDAEETTDIAVDDARVFWVGHAAHLASAPKGGGSMQILASGSIGHVALDGGLAYFTRTDGVFRVPAFGGAETRVASGDGVDPLAVGDQVYFVERGLGVLRAAPKTGGDSHVIASAPDLVSVYDLVADSSGVYGVTTSAGSVWRADDRGIVPLAAGFHCPAGIAVRGGDVLFGNEAIACDLHTVYGDRAIVGVHDGATRIVVKAEQGGVQGVAADDTNVYWAGDGVWCARR